MYERENVPESNLVGRRPLQKFEMRVDVKRMNIYFNAFHENLHLAVSDITNIKKQCINVSLLHGEEKDRTESGTAKYLKV